MCGEALWAPRCILRQLGRCIREERCVLVAGRCEGEGQVLGVEGEGEGMRWRWEVYYGVGETGDRSE